MSCKYRFSRCLHHITSNTLHSFDSKCHSIILPSVVRKILNFCQFEQQNLIENKQVLYV